MKLIEIPALILEPKYDVAVLLPTRGRTTALLDSLNSLVDHADDIKSIQIILGMDNDDAECVQWAAENIFKEYSSRGISTSIMEFTPMGYTRLNEYVTSLAKNSNARWLMFWNDDAIMKTQGWDSRIREYNGKFRVLRMPTHNEHPYAVFPIVPRDWLMLFDYLSAHQLSDAWISQIAYILNIMETIPVEVLHDRHDLTGNNDDDTYRNRIMFEGRPEDPRDFNHISWRRHRFIDARKIAWFMYTHGEDVSWFMNVCKGTQDPWERMLNEFDPNEQMKRFK